MIRWEPLSTLQPVYSLTFHIMSESWALKKKKERKKAQALDWEAGNEGLCSCFSGSVHCSDSGDKNVACVSLRALVCRMHQSCGADIGQQEEGGEGRSVGLCGGRNEDRREQPQSGLPASWLDCWKLLLSSCVGPPLPAAYSSVLTMRWTGSAREAKRKVGSLPCPFAMTLYATNKG